MNVKQIVTLPVVLFFLRSTFVLSICWLSFVSLGTVNADEVDASDERIAYVGRWDRSKASAPWCAWQGSSVKTQFRGTAIHAEISSDLPEYIRVILDGDSVNSRKLKLKKGRATYALLADSANGKSAAAAASDHVVEIVKETYSGRGRMTFHGFVLRDGQLLAQPVAKPRLRIEFYGDSNLAGYSLEHEKNNGDAAQTGCHFTYAGIAARMLGAEYQNISSSGAIISGRENAVMSFYNRMDFYNSTPRFDFDSFPADVCVINIGANDVNGKSKEQIKADFKTLVATIRKIRPAAEIVLMNGYGWDRSEPANYTDEVIKEIDDSKLTRVVFPWLFNEWHGCEYDHAGMARFLVDHLSKLSPQWKPVAASDVMNGFGREGDVANGSFEQVAPFGGYGWRYFQDGAQRVHAPLDSGHGSWFLRLTVGTQVHQANPTRKNQSHTIRLKMRGKVSSRAIVRVEFRDQKWRNEIEGTAADFPFDVGSEWQDYSFSFVSPAGHASGDRSREPWQVIMRLIAKSGTVDFDDIRLSGK